MPLTAYSISQRKELDVEQLLASLSSRDGGSFPTSTEQIPEAWRDFIRQDIECPCCFVKGAEIVRSASTRTARWSRQAFFRFSKPGHSELCDFAAGDASNVSPETAIAFGTTKSGLTRAVRDLVCAGIHLQIFDQKTIRDMREWFFAKKRQSSFVVTLDPRLPRWIHQLALANFRKGRLPEGVELTEKIVSMPAFDWKAEAARMVVQRHRTTMDAINKNPKWAWSHADRVEALAKRYQGQLVFDPQTLKTEHGLSRELSEFLAHNHAWVSESAQKDATSIPNLLLAFAALLLFVNDWGMAGAIENFSEIVAALGQADPSLGNVIGLNPFHDYRAWETLKALQEAELAATLDIDPRDEVLASERELRARFSG